MQPSYSFHTHQVHYFLILLLLTLTLRLLGGIQTQAAPSATDCVAQTDIPQAECETLVALYSDTDGLNWTNNSGWNTTNTPCNWHGITCNSGKAQAISLSGNQLSGSIPDLSSLSSLQSLYLHTNSLSGSIPDFSILSGLQYLHLQNNQLNGNVPASVCQATGGLNLGNNMLNVATTDSCIDMADSGWKESQTVPPSNVTGLAISATAIQLIWDSIAYTQHGGYYSVWGKAQDDTVYTLVTTTADKTSSSIIISGLHPSTMYEFVTRTFTPAHDD